MILLKEIMMERRRVLETQLEATLWTMLVQLSIVTRNWIWWKCLNSTAFNTRIQIFCHNLTYRTKRLQIYRIRHSHPWPSSKAVRRRKTIRKIPKVPQSAVKKKKMYSKALPLDLKTISFKTEKLIETRKRLDYHPFLWCQPSTMVSSIQT